MKITIAIEVSEPKTEKEVQTMAAISSGLKKFELGDVCVTQGIAENFTEGFVILCITRHTLGDWGDLDEEDKESNNIALIGEERIFSVYESAERKKLYVITERDRKLTTIMLPEEY
jgi:hypothetical protein